MKQILVSAYELSSFCNNSNSNNNKKPNKGQTDIQIEKIYAMCFPYSIYYFTSNISQSVNVLNIYIFLIWGENNQWHDMGAGGRIRTDHRRINAKWSLNMKRWSTSLRRGVHIKIILRYNFLSITLSKIPKSDNLLYWLGCR